MGTVESIIYDDMVEFENKLPSAVIVRLKDCQIPKEHCFNNEKDLVCIEPVIRFYENDKRNFRE